MKDARFGMQTGDVAWKLANLVPFAASASIFGVLTTGCPAQLIQSLRNWSVIMKRKFGRICDVILRPLGLRPEEYYALRLIEAKSGLPGWARCNRKRQIGVLAEAV
tara:strand:+ start:249 stop:566 length:318 start_codon:yes stop_codon:yes gene_type:complete